MVKPKHIGSALIGATGFVGTSLLRQRAFDATFDSTNINSLGSGNFSLIVCAGASAQKWIANREPEQDRARLASLMQALSQVQCERFVLISTVDVFSDSVDVDETSVVEVNGLPAYGLHRFEIEQLVKSRFPGALIVRLPGLVGPGLRKNAVYDLHHSNNWHTVDSRSILQFYPMVRLWTDIEVALAASLGLVHLTAQPVSIAEVAAHGFGRPFSNALVGTPAHYNFKSKYAALFGGAGSYQYSKRESLLAISAYAQSEPRRGGPP